MAGKSPNAGHKALVELEQYFDVQIVTQNIDNLHELAGSTNITHLHGELTKLRNDNSSYIIDIGLRDQELTESSPAGELLRPHIVFFGEAVPMFDKARDIVKEADLLIVVGTSLAVYPAAMLVRYAKSGVPIYVVDPGNPDTSMIRNPLTHIKARAAEGMPQLAKELIEKR
jgi:NAD-dependent deacetylase